MSPSCARTTSPGKGAGAQSLQQMLRLSSDIVLMRCTSAPRAVSLSVVSAQCSVEQPAHEITIRLYTR
eukprot:4050931-Prymnesium_polylepis.2